jgi:hypothetical protein
MGQCRDCGKEIEFTKNWRGQWVIIDPDPDEHARESYYEPVFGEFVGVFRHVCLVRAEKKARGE